MPNAFCPPYGFLTDQLTAFGLHSKKSFLMSIGHSSSWPSSHMPTSISDTPSSPLGHAVRMVLSCSGLESMGSSTPAHLQSPEHIDWQFLINNHLGSAALQPTWPASKEFNEEVEDVVEVVGSLGRHCRDIVARALLGGHALPAVALAERVQVVGHLPDVGALRLLLDAPPHSARRRRRQCGQCWKRRGRPIRDGCRKRTGGKSCIPTRTAKNDFMLLLPSPRFHLRLLRPAQVIAACTRAEVRTGSTWPHQRRVAKTALHLFRHLSYSFGINCIYLST